MFFQKESHFSISVWKWFSHTSNALCARRELEQNSRHHLKQKQKVDSFSFFFFSDQKSKAKVRIRWTMFCAYLLSMTSLHHPRKKNDKLG